MALITLMGQFHQNKHPISSCSILPGSSPLALKTFHNMFGSPYSST